MSEPIPTARFVITEDNLIEAIVRGTADAQRALRWRYAAYSAAMIASWFFLHPYSGGVAPFLLLYGAFVFAALALIRPWLVRRQIHRVIRSRPELNRPMELRVTDDSFQVDVPGVFRSSQFLTTLYAAISQSDGTLIQPFPNEFMWVPDTAFASVDERARFDQALFSGLRIPDPAL